MMSLHVVLCLVVLVCQLAGSFRLQRTIRHSFRDYVQHLMAPAAECDLATEGSIPCDVVESTTSSIPSPSVWTVFGELATKTGACNLGQGFPDWNPPQFMLESFQQAGLSQFHQYTRPSGHPPLVELLAGRYSKHLNRAIDPFNEIAVTVGASQALYLALTCFLQANDEIVLFEPFFDLYMKQIKLTGATPKFVPLGGKSATLADPWALDIEALKKAITPQTKILILNSPHNPTGKVFTLAEMEAIADIVRAYPNLIVISDEVYKFSVYNPLEHGDSTSIGHYHFARLPGMWDRTITLSSCGKTFSVTGWQAGWTVGPAKFVRPMQELLPCVQFCASTPIQHALTLALPKAEQPHMGEPSYYEWLRQQFLSKRSILEEGLRAAGIEPVVSHGGFFLMGRLPIHDDLRPYSMKAPGQQLAPEDAYDWQFCRKLATDYGVIGIPASPFFSPGSEAALSLGPLARFAFCKQDETLHLAANRLKARAAENRVITTTKTTSPVASVISSSSAR